MARKKAIEKTEVQSLPTEYTLGGHDYTLVPKEEWTIEQDDYAMAILTELSFGIRDIDKEDGGGGGLKLVQALMRTGLYREMLGVALVCTSTERKLTDNVNHFKNLRFGKDDALTPTMAAVSTFFGSGEN